MQNALDFQYSSIDVVRRDLVNLVGLNWLVCCPDRDLCTRLHSILGGRIVIEEYVSTAGDLAFRPLGRLSVATTTADCLLDGHVSCHQRRH